MKKTYKHKMIVGLALTTLAGTSVMSLSAPAFLNNITVAHADSSAIADNTSQRSITLTKYAIQNESQLGAPGDGTEWNNPDNLATLKNVKFKLVRVKPLEGGQPLVDASTAVEGTDYEIDTTFAPREAITDDAGQVKFDLGTGKANDGIYMLVEEDSNVGTVYRRLVQGRLTKMSPLNDSNSKTMNLSMTGNVSGDNLIKMNPISPFEQLSMDLAAHIISDPMQVMVPFFLLLVLPILFLNFI